MKIIVDTNIIFSAAIFPNSKIAKMMDYIINNHILVLSNTIIDEAKNVIAKKLPDKILAFQTFLDTLSYELFNIPIELLTQVDYKISDSKDIHVLASALYSDADLLITGDSHFFEYKYSGIEILKPNDFINQYNIEHELVK